MEELSKEQLNIIYDGVLLREGLMDVRDLAPALLSLGELFQNSNRVLNGDKARVSVHVKAGIERGSFELGIVLDQSLLQQAFDLFRSTTDIFTPGEIAELIFGPIGLVAFLKWAMGRKTEEPKMLEDNRVEVTIKDNTFITNNYVYNLYGDVDVRRALDETVKPLEREGIDSLEVRKRMERMEHIAKEEAKYLALPKPEEDEEVFESTEVGIFEFVKLSFTEQYKWAFTDGEKHFHADMEDQSFFERVQQREISFARGDILKCEMNKRTWPTKTGLKTEYKVLRVLDVIPAARQLPLIETDDAESPIETPTPDTEGPESQ